MIIDLMKRSSEASANWTGRTLSYFVEWSGTVVSGLEEVSSDGDSGDGGGKGS